MKLKQQVVERVRELLGDRSIAKAGQDWGIPQSTLHSWLANGREPKLENLERICEIENVSLEWLFTGIKNDDADYCVIPFVDVEASAGSGTWIINEKLTGGLKVSKAWLRCENLNNKNLVMLRARGDSMEPTIPNGAPLLIDTNVNSCPQDGIYVIRINNDLLVKRLRVDPFNNQIQVISDNKLYTPILVEGSKLEELKIIGKVERVTMLSM